MTAVGATMNDLWSDALARRKVLCEKAVALKRVYDVLYMDTDSDGKPFYNPDLLWAGKHAKEVAEIVHPFFEGDR